MTNIANWSEDFLTDRLHIGADIAGVLSTSIIIIAMILAGIGINWLIQSIFRWISGHSSKVRRSKWHPFLNKRRIGHHILLLIPGLILYFLPYLAFGKDTDIIRLLHRADIIYMLIVMIMVGNAMLLAFLDFYRTTDKNRSHPLQGLVQGLQVILYFVGGIIITAVLIDKSPTVLLTGLGASAAVLMLIFKDSILGFVAGVQLSQNSMIRIGDWIQMPDGSANGTVEEITLNTVKVRNWDNTLTMIPPYTLVSAPFKNWRGMQESGGRRADKSIFIDVTSLEVCNQDMIADICKTIPVMDGWRRTLPDGRLPEGSIENIRLFRTYTELYLRNHPDVNATLDLIVTQKEATPYGVPVYVYFFVKDKAWASFERKQSDIFDHLMSIVPEFGLRIYQRP
ncbi:MAG: mechanosensitive ion channel family protein [Bacteroidales bacterium]|nr:mechanosensitive ion channel family protein [Bacteroidales bacterium]